MVLPKAVATEHFAFYGTILSGTTQMPERSQDAIAATNAALGQAVGQLYSERYFPASAKAKAQAMVADLIAAYRARIPNLKWMSPQTKEKALAKLEALHVGVGYPDTWIDYSSLEIVRGDAFGNMRRAEAFSRSRNLAKLKRQADPNEWRIDPQIVGAVILFSPNTETFSAGILQPPYFDPEGDTASNYGSAGAGMAHESVTASTNSAISTMRKAVWESGGRPRMLPTTTVRRRSWRRSSTATARFPDSA